VLYCTFGLISGSLWGRKAWGVWWQWDAKLTMAFMLEMIFLGYLIVRKYGGPGSEKLSAAMGIFGAATAPFIYKSADWWRTIHPQTSVMKTLGKNAPPMWNVVWFCGTAFVLLFLILLALRVGLEERRAELDRLYLEAEA
jgi:heme exporter protein C